MPILLVALLAGAVGPAPARIEDVAARPATFDGKWLRLRGQINQCTHFSCAICPEDASGAVKADSKCLALDWDRQVGDRREAGANFDPIYRYASVEIVARFDQACLQGICTDRAPVLFETRVERVFKRRPSALGLNSRRAIDRMIDPPPAAAAALIAVLRRIDGVPDDAPSPARYRVFADPHDRAMESGAIICRSPGADGNPATWPADSTSAIVAPSTEDHFKCYFARYADGRWTVSPD
jgi:hypothetical protein